MSAYVRTGPQWASHKDALECATKADLFVGAVEKGTVTVEIFEAFSADVPVHILEGFGLDVRVAAVVVLPGEEAILARLPMVKATEQAIRQKAASN